MIQPTRATFALGLPLFALGAGVACSHQERPRTPTEPGAAQQAIVERSAAAFTQLRQGKYPERLQRLTQHARGIMIFPRLVKASLIFGGEGGNGVALAPDASKPVATNP